MTDPKTDPLRRFHLREARRKAKTGTRNLRKAHRLQQLVARVRVIQEQLAACTDQTPRRDREKLFEKRRYYRRQIIKLTLAKDEQAD